MVAEITEEEINFISEFMHKNDVHLPIDKIMNFEIEQTIFVGNLNVIAITESKFKKLPGIFLTLLTPCEQRAYI